MVIEAALLSYREEERGVFVEMKSGYFKMIMVGFIWGTIGAFARWSGLPPLELTFLRFLLAAIALFFLAPRYERLLAFSKRDCILILFAGLLFVADSILFFMALRLTTISNAVIPYYMQPVFIVILTPVLFKERQEAKCYQALLLSLAGLGILLLPSLINLSYNDMAGIGLALAGAFLLSLIALINKIINIHPFVFVYYKMVIATFCLLPFIKLETMLTGSPLIAVAALGVVHTALAYSLYYDALKTVKNQYGITLTYFSPLVASLTGFLFFQEAITPFTIAGGLLIVANSIIFFFSN